MNQSPNKQTRYPGTLSFTDRDQYLFFGRDDDIEKLSQLIGLESLIVLYGKSGMGKTSLLHAGVIPRLSEREHYETIDIEFGRFTPESDENPTRILRQKISEKVSFDNFLWEKMFKHLNLQGIPPDLETVNSKIPNVLWYYSSFKRDFFYKER